MANIIHKNFSGAEAVHPAAYVQSTDPGAVGAAKFWVDTSIGSGTVDAPYALKKRNTANTAWEYVGGLTDLSISGPATGEGLVYDATLAKFKNARPAGVSIALARACI